MATLDKKIYEQIIGDQRQEAKPIWQSTAFLLHLLFKCIPLGLNFMEPIFLGLFSQTILTELILIFIVVDFWMTKNITGRKLIGIRWYFGDDEYGVERFMFECRANDEYVSPITPKIFWGIQLIYCIFPLFLLFQLYALASPNMFDVEPGDAMILIAIFFGGFSNFFFFFRASSASSDKQQLLKEKLGRDFIQKMGAASIISHL